MKKAPIWVGALMNFSIHRVYRESRGLSMGGGHFFVLTRVHRIEPASMCGDCP
jgi:hypothetical protein